MPDIEPYEALSKIKKSLAELKNKKPASAGYQTTLDELKKNMEYLTTLFKETTEEIKLEEQAEERIEQELHPLAEKLNEIEEENKQIAIEIFKRRQIIIDT